MNAGRHTLVPYRRCRRDGCGCRASADASVLPLAQAQEIAIRNQPRLAAATLSAQTGASLVKEVRAAYFPTLVGNVTVSGAESSATLSAGALTTSSLYSRAAAGVVVNQLVSDFGRTGKLPNRVPPFAVPR